MRASDAYKLDELGNSEITTFAAKQSGKPDWGTWLAILVIGIWILAWFAPEGVLKNVISILRYLAMVVGILGLVTFRFFFLVPSVVVLTAGGICFGTALGGALGAVGVFFTGILQFTLLRTIKPAWLMRKIDAAGTAVRALERGAPFAVALSTAIPPTPMTPFHCAAAFTPISLTAFSVVLFVGSLVRSRGHWSRGGGGVWRNRFPGVGCPGGRNADLVFALAVALWWGDRLTWGNNWFGMSTREINRRLDQGWMGV